MLIKKLNPVFLVFSSNLATLALKIVAYLNSKSAAVLSDLLNDTADFIGSLSLILGIYLMKRGVKNRIYYPFGISRAVYVFGLISVSVIGGILFTIAIIKGINTLVGKGPVVSTRLSMISLASSQAINTGLAIYSYHYYVHHKRDPSVIGSLVDSLTDALGNLAALLALITKSYYIDGVGSLFISFVLLASSISIGYRYFLMLIGRSPPKEDLLRIINTIVTTPGVYDVNELRAVMVTESEYMVLAEVEIEKDMSLTDMEKLSKEIENRVKMAVPEVKFFAVKFVARRDEPATYRRLLELIKRSEH